MATLRRKVTKFALMPERPEGEASQAAGVIDGDVLEDAYQALLSIGHTPMDARDRLDKALAGGKRYKTVDELLLAIYNRGEKE